MQWGGIFLSDLVSDMGECNRTRLYFLFKKKDSCVDLVICHSGLSNRESETSREISVFPPFTGFAQGFE